MDNDLAILARGAHLSSIERLHEIMKRLRDPKTGCPWDRVQTLETLKPCVLEETYELLSAMNHPDDRGNYIEELGDVLLQVMFQCVMAEQVGTFTFDEVVDALSDKLIRRHPHVFGDVVAKDPATVLKNWEHIKQQEHKKEARHSALDGVPATLPGLLKAQRSQEKASRVGYKWPEAENPLQQIQARVTALTEKVTAKQSAEANGGQCGVSREDLQGELGGLLLAITDLSRQIKCDAESALESATAQFSEKFREAERNGSV